jgi:ADP-dependent NAD(P)H-hydrate dehydratase / NAD(P)H-hydrate epimerase
VIALLTAAEMRAADAEASRALGTPRLMENAGARIAEFIATTYKSGTIVAFAGPGNNGGDAFAALASLGPAFERIIYAAPCDRPSEARREAEARALAAGIAVQPLPGTYDEACEALRNACLGVDALLGTGSRLPLADALRPAARALNRSRLPVLAIDIPSGVDADSGACDTDAVRATATIALGALKPGLLFDPGFECVGELMVAGIGIDDRILQSHAKTYAALDDAEFLALLPQRSDDADKRSAGAPLIIAGSEQFPGAAVLCARGAARGGAGYVTIATSRAAAPLIRTHLIEQVVVTFGDGSPTDAADMLIDLCRHSSAVAIGPGLGLDDWTGTMLLDFIGKLTLPFVLDASALFHIAKRLDLLAGKACVVTPHAGEFARLSGLGTIRSGERVARLREFVARTGITTLLKGRDTLVFDGSIVHVNTTGNKALATAGSGDTLTGIIATLLAQGCSPLDAARVGAYWHGLAGRYCEDVRGIGVVAGDLSDALGPAMLRSQASPRGELRRVSASSSR